MRSVSYLYRLTRNDEIVSCERTRSKFYRVVYVAMRVASDSVNGCLLSCFYNQRDACFDIRKSVEIVRRVNREILNILADIINRTENTLHNWAFRVEDTYIISFNKM